jgi:lipopolysaccharide export LptBFGC system permease protein LptF
MLLLDKLLLKAILSPPYFVGALIAVFLATLSRFFAANAILLLIAIIVVYRVMDVFVDMSRHGELFALISAGISAKRVALVPTIIGSVVMVVALVVISVRTPAADMNDYLLSLSLGFAIGISPAIALWISYRYRKSPDEAWAYLFLGGLVFVVSNLIFWSTTRMTMPVLTFVPDAILLAMVGRFYLTT